MKALEGLVHDGAYTIEQA
jgi:CheY-like chemotaxis protein